MALYEERHTPVTTTDELLEELRYRRQMRGRRYGDSTLTRSEELLREMVGDSSHLYERPTALVPSKILSVERYMRK